MIIKLVLRFRLINLPNCLHSMSLDQIFDLVDLFKSFVDIDGNGEVDELTDGLLILRFLFGPEGNALTNGVVAPDVPQLHMI